MKNILKAIIVTTAIFTSCASNNLDSNKPNQSASIKGNWKILEVIPTTNIEVNKSDSFGLFMINMAAAMSTNQFIYRNDTLFFDSTPKATYKITGDAINFNIFSDGSTLISYFKQNSDTLKIFNFPETGFTSVFKKQ